MNSNTNTAVNFYWENIGFHNLHCDSKLSCDVRLCPWEWLESQPLPVEAAIAYPMRQKHLLWKRQGRRSLENKVSALPDPPVRRTLLAAFKASLVISAGCAHLHVIFPLRLALSLGSLTWGNTALSGSLLWELQLPQLPQWLSIGYWQARVLMTSPPLFVFQLSLPGVLACLIEGCSAVCLSTAWSLPLALAW